MASSITVDPTQFDNPVLRGLKTLERLRAAGVPVIGVLWPEGVEYGHLELSEPDLGSGEVTYTWVV
jgi:hypothetical protein